MDLSPSDIEAALNQAIPAAFERFRKSTLQMVFPVGSIYTSLTASTNPATLLGFGTWVQLEAGRCLVAQGTGYDAGATGGSATKSITTANMPAHSHGFSGSTNTVGAHTHTRGSMEITGQFHGADHGYPSGAFYRISQDGTTGGGDGRKQWVGFQASRTWTGATSSEGSHGHTVTGTVTAAGSGEAFNVEQPYLVVYMWKRTA